MDDSKDNKDIDARLSVTAPEWVWEAAKKRFEAGGGKPTSNRRGGASYDGAGRAALEHYAANACTALDASSRPLLTTDEIKAIRVVVSLLERLVGSSIDDHEEGLEP